MTTLSTYLNNIINNPNETKFKKIKQENKAFQSRIASLKQVDSLMVLLNFSLVNIEGVNYYQYSSSASTEAIEHSDIQHLSNWIYHFTLDPVKIIFKLDHNPILYYKGQNSSSSRVPELGADFYNISKNDLKGIYNSKKTENELNSILRFLGGFTYL